MNKGVYIALISIGLAQFFKIPLHFFKTKKWDNSLFFQTGGMPSSHSAGVSSLTTFVALKRGLPTIDFALSLIFGLIVMYDAQGIRRQTGELTLKVNNLGDLVDKINKDKNIQYTEKPKKLKQMLGHQPEEVFGGAILGIIIGLIGHLLTKPKSKYHSFFK
ncbi:divergent PAP2 family protein [Bacillus sp. B1-b2]|uniref:divergent PAP2 family protein n=1 Tax=Bacillus sp. B1-b2 TaxID=2653201 RepID=UPI001261FE6F|nr:divergent PAP2 family protein [Bacillus sp. B1-b2]KAB7672982.1 divergent PAP2 family protein [Bacillus sp. B1-b2]